MPNQLRYQKGQRWEFKSDVAEFEKTLVIGNVIEAHPEWGWNEAKYEVYVKYSAVAKPSIPKDYDGVILSLSKEGLDRSVLKFLEKGVKLPWWWIHGRRLAKKSDAPGGRGVFSSDRVGDSLPGLFALARQTEGFARQRANAIQKHFARFKGRARPSPSKSIAESWKRIAAWVEEHAPAYGFKLNAGASTKAITAFERTIETKLPDDFKESVRLHDGGDGSMPPNEGEFLSLDQILQQWKMYKGWQEEGNYANDDWPPRDIKGPIKPIFWNLKRIPITDNSGDHLILDLDPPKEGVYGQIIHHNHEVGPTEVLAPSWADFLRQLVEDLESGKYVYFEDEGCLELFESQDQHAQG